MKIDYVWTDGKLEHLFTGEDALKRALAVLQTYGRGKVWCRQFDPDGYLVGVTMVV